MPDELEMEIDCPAVKQLLDEQADCLLLDVRTPAEREVAALEPSMLIPIQVIAERADELQPHKDQRIIVYCHHGGRSEQVTTWLRQQGFSKAQNMTGGIDAWAVQVDPSLPRY